MKPYSVSIDSSGFSADWNDLFVVIARTLAEALAVGEQYIRDTYPLREITRSRASVFRGEARVVGHLIIPGVLA